MTPAWFNYQTYFDNKLAQLIRDDALGDWDDAKLIAAFEAAGYTFDDAGMYRHFEEWGNTVPENISPSPYFIVADYMQNKLEWMYENVDGLNADNYTLQNLEQAFAAAGLTAWNHYTQYGFVEGINPSPYFNTGDYMAAKLEQMRADYDASYSEEQLDNAFLAAHLNPIMHYFDYGKDEGVDYTPAEPPAPPFVWDAEKALTTDIDSLASPAGQNVLFTASVSDDGDANTLQAQDQIHAGEAPIKNGLQVIMDKSNFQGLDAAQDGAPAVTGISEASIVNARASGGVTFNAQNIAGVETWNLDSNGNGAVNVSNLEKARITVNIQNQPRGTDNISFAPGAASGQDDALTLGVENSGSAKNPVSVTGLDGIEHLTVTNATEKPGYVDLAQVSPDALYAAGEGPINITAVGKSVTLFDASKATGDVTANLANGALADGIVGGSGDDTFVINPNWTNNAPIDGGRGTDTVAIEGPATFHGSDNWTSVEQIQVTNATAIFGASQLPDLETAIVSGATLRLNQLEENELTVIDNGADKASDVELMGNVTTSSANASYNPLDTVNYQLTAPAGQTAPFTSQTSLATNALGVVNVTTDGLQVKGKEISTFAGTVTAENADELNVDANGILGGAFFDVPNAEEINIDAAQGGLAAGIDTSAAGINSSAVSLNTGSSGDAAVTITSHGGISLDGTHTDLSGVGSLTVNQYGGMFDANSTQSELSNVHSITLNGYQGTDKTGVTLGNIGNVNLADSVDINASNLGALTLGNIDTKGDVDMEVGNCNGPVAIGFINGQIQESSEIAAAGDVNISVGNVGGVTFGGANGRNVSVDFANVAVQGGTGQAVHGGVVGNTTLAGPMLAAETLTYTGTAADETIFAYLWGEGSNINAGGGNNTINLTPGTGTPALANPVTATINAAAGNNTINIATSDDATHKTFEKTILTINGFGAGDKIQTMPDNSTPPNPLPKFAALTSSNVQIFLENWGVTSDASSVTSDDIVAGGYAVRFGGNTYAFMDTETEGLFGSGDVLVIITGTPNLTGAGPGAAAEISGV